MVECHNPYFSANIVQIKSRIGDPDYLGWWKSIILGRGGGGLEGEAEDADGAVGADGEGR